MAGCFFVLILLLIPVPSQALDVCATIFAQPAPGRVVFDAPAGFRFDGEAFAREWDAIVGSQVHGSLAGIASGSRALKDREAASGVSTGSPHASLMSLRTQASVERPLRVLVTAGIHGNEPLGVQTALDLVRALRSRPQLAAQVELTVVPALNLEGLNSATRRTPEGVDLNRAFSENREEARQSSRDFDPDLSQVPKSAALLGEIKTTIGETNFDISLDLHGANGRKDFFVIRARDDHGLSSSALRQAMSREFLLKADSGADAGAVGVKTKAGYEEQRYTLQQPGLSTSANAGTLKGYMAARGALAYTLEYPGLLPLETARALNLELVLAMIERAVVTRPSEARTLEKKTPPRL